MLTVPVSLMLTIDSIPESFLVLFPEGTSTHAILAAYLTHGDPEDLSRINVWRAVWPSWEEFEESMPIFWTKSQANGDGDADRDKNTSRSAERTAQNDNSILNASFLPPSISNHWATLETRPGNSDTLSGHLYETQYQNLLAQQSKRLKDTWASVNSVFPGSSWTHFARNWAIVNSRSFYYVSPGKGEPEDWNDALAMVPYADYFNHVDDAVRL